MTQTERCMIEEAHLITGLPERTLQSLSAQGQIWGAAKLGRRWTYDRQRLRAWVRAKEANAESRATSISEVKSGMRVSPLMESRIDSRLKQAIDAKLRGA